MLLDSNCRSLVKDGFVPLLMAVVTQKETELVSKGKIVICPAPLPTYMHIHRWKENFIMQLSLPYETCLF